MSSILRYLQSSIGKKQVVGLSGLLMSGFILTHMAGNMLLLVGSDSYNHYAHAMTSNPLLPVAELGLIVLFLTHVIAAIAVTLDNRRARPVGNAVKSKTDKAARFGSRSMILTGLVVLVFLVLHIITFRLGTYYSTTIDGVEVRDLYRLVLERFQDPLYVVWYLFSLVILWLHTCHGFSAVFQSLGVASVRNQGLAKTGYAVATLIIVGFMSQPIYFMFFTGRPE
jgi:succinate dehydrogenase / fumarate reductase, cytochrome b subunit